MLYTDYLQTEHWKLLRERYLTPSKRKFCFFCKSTQDLHIHHKRYSYKKKSILFNETNKHLITLCKDCHFLWHEINGKKVMCYGDTKRIQKLLRNNFSKEIAFKNHSKLLTEKILKEKALAVQSKGSTADRMTDRPTEM